MLAMFVGIRIHKRRNNNMLKGFNAFQLTTLFAAAPFGIEWVKNAAFYGHNVLFWVLIVAYVIGFFGMTYAVYDTFSE